MFLQSILPALACAQQKPDMVVQSARQGNVEMPLSGFADFITPIEHFFVRNHAYIPSVDLKAWRLEVGGEVDKPLSLTLAELRKMPRAELTAVLECAGNGRSFFEPPVPGVQWRYGAVGNARWAGVRLADVLRKAGLRGNTREILFDGADVPPGAMPKFQRTLPVSKALDPDTLLAYEMNGQALPPAHGGPVRAVVPGWAGDNWLKWIARIEARSREFDGFYMSTAYRMPVRPAQPGTAVSAGATKPITTLRVKSVIAAPADGSSHAAQVIRVAGAAWSGEAPVESVELSADAGRTWRAARFISPRLPYAWRFWEQLWMPQGEGRHVLMARARDGAGRVQPLAPEWNPSGYLWNAVQRVAVEIGGSARQTGRELKPERASPAPGVKAACLTCHDADLIEQQRLTRAQWERELDKMIRWGAPVRPQDREEILGYLIRYGPEK